MGEKKDRKYIAYETVLTLRILVYKTTLFCALQYIIALSDRQNTPRSRDLPNVYTFASAHIKLMRFSLPDDRRDIRRVCNRKQKTRLSSYTFIRKQILKKKPGICSLGRVSNSTDYALGGSHLQFRSCSLNALFYT